MSDAALGMSRQAAQQRFGKRIGDAPDPLWFPLAYFKRPLGIPALPEPVSGDYLMEP